MLFPWRDSDSASLSRCRTVSDIGKYVPIVDSYIAPDSKSAVQLDDVVIFCISGVDHRCLIPLVYCRRSCRLKARFDA